MRELIWLLISVPVNVVASPNQVKMLHSKIMEGEATLHWPDEMFGNISSLELSDYLESQAGLTLLACEEGPALVTVVNSSRVVADIKRDLGRVLAGWSAHISLLPGEL